MVLYILKVLLISGALYSLYKLFLSKTTSFKFNRFFLLAILIVSVILPIVSFNVSPTLEGNVFISKGSKLISEVSVVSSQIEQNNVIQRINYESFSLLIVGYLSVCCLMLIRMLFNCRSLFSKKIMKGNKLNGMQLYFTNNGDSIFSFFNRLYLPIKYNNEQLNESILQHEIAHFKQLHGIDNIISEMYLILFWFNPTAWLIRKSIKKNHEYLADSKVIQDTDIKNYMQTIVNHIKNSNQPRLVSGFSYLSIKNRFIMLQKKKSKLQQTSAITLSLILSTCLFSLFAFKSTAVNQKIEQQITAQSGFDLYKKPSGFPIEFKAISKIASEFGMRKHPLTKEDKMHKGVDLIAAEGTPILATEDGKVVKAEFSKGYGNHIVVQHNIKYKTLYAHLSSLNVKIGDVVKKKQNIGVIGTTGQSLSVHLHYEIHEYEKPINPDLESDC